MLNEETLFKNIETVNGIEEVQKVISFFNNKTNKNNTAIITDSETGIITDFPIKYSDLSLAYDYPELLHKKTLNFIRDNMNMF